MSGRSLIPGLRSRIGLSGHPRNRTRSSRQSDSPRTHIGVPAAVVFPAFQIESHRQHIALLHDAGILDATIAPYRNANLAGVLAFGFKYEFLTFPRAVLALARHRFFNLNQFCCKFHIAYNFYLSKRAAKLRKCKEIFPATWQESINILGNSSAVRPLSSPRTEGTINILGNPRQKPHKTKPAEQDSQAAKKLRQRSQSAISLCFAYLGPPGRLHFLHHPADHLFELHHELGGRVFPVGYFP